MYSVIVLAAGSASRMEGINKQLAEIGGMPVFVLSALKFQLSEQVAEIIITCPKGYEEEYASLAHKHGISKLKVVVGGGTTRFLSVREALSHVDEYCTHIAIHDGARPLISTYDIDRVLDDAVKHGAAIAAAKATDTVKIVNNNTISNTPPRSTLYYAQTPQAFDKAIYISSCEQLGTEAENVTDDSCILEQCGKPVHITEITACNMKITRPDDLAAARVIYGGTI